MTSKQKLTEIRLQKNAAKAAKRQNRLDAAKAKLREEIELAKIELAALRQRELSPPPTAHEVVVEAFCKGFALTSEELADSPPSKQPPEI